VGWRWILGERRKETEGEDGRRQEKESGRRGEGEGRESKNNYARNSFVVSHQRHPGIEYQRDTLLFLHLQSSRPIHPGLPIIP
jgi:hypothetical protein